MKRVGDFSLSLAYIGGGKESPGPVVASEPFTATFAFD